REPERRVDLQAACDLLRLERVPVLVRLALNGCLYGRGGHRLSTLLSVSWRRAIQCPSSHTPSRMNVAVTPRSWDAAADSTSSKPDERTFLGRDGSCFRLRPAGALPHRIRQEAERDNGDHRPERARVVLQRVH